jgi:hypothetical protein
MDVTDHAFCRETVPNEDNMDNHSLETDRLEVLKEMAAEICHVTPNEIFMINTIQVTDKETTNKFIFSDVLLDWRSALKIQLHIPFNDKTVPIWFNIALAQSVQHFVLDGISVFSMYELESGINSLLSRHNTLRVKLGIGRGGTDQYIVSKENTNQVIKNIAQTWTANLVKETGVVIEENIEYTNPPLSYTSLDYPCQSKPLSSLGVIIENEYNENQKTYIGTSCIATGDVVLEDVTINDPIHGKIVIEAQMCSSVAYVGEKVANAYRKNVVGILPRINLDFLITENNDYKAIDPSLRLGGNSWCELRAVQRFNNDLNLQKCVHLVRVVYTQEDRDLYLSQWENCKVLCESKDDSKLWHSIVVCEHE